MGKSVLAVTAQAIAPARPALANLAKIPLTVLGFASVDTGIFFANMIAGFIVTGVTLMLIEHMIADE